MSVPRFAIPREPARRRPVWEDILAQRDRLECAEWIGNHAPEHVRRNLELGRSRPWLQAADGIYYRDTRTPINAADQPSVTLAATAKALWVSTQGATALPANYWTVGKHVALTAFGRMTSAATPGNITVSINNAVTDAGGTAVSMTAVAWTLNRTNDVWQATANVHCRAISSAGTLMMTGLFVASVASIASTLQPCLIPGTAPATVTQDTTAAGGITLQALRSGSTAETMQVHELLFEALT